MAGCAGHRRWRRHGIKALAEAHLKWHCRRRSVAPCSIEERAPGLLAARARLHLYYTDTAPTAVRCRDVLPDDALRACRRKKIDAEIHRRLKSWRAFCHGASQFSRRGRAGAVAVAALCGFRLSLQGVEPANARKGRHPPSARPCRCLGPEQEEEQLRSRLRERAPVLRRHGVQGRVAQPERRDGTWRNRRSREAAAAPSSPPPYFAPMPQTSITTRATMRRWGLALRLLRP